MRGAVPVEEAKLHALTQAWGVFGVAATGLVKGSGRICEGGRVEVEEMADDLACICDSDGCDFNSSLTSWPGGSLSGERYRAALTRCSKMALMLVGQ